jgi:serine/threonine protein kinase
MRTLTFNRIIGAGAMGTVYHADLHVAPGGSRACAVKVMKGSTPDQEQFRARMRDEARLLGMLQDEQILGVSELLKVQGLDCVLMEYVEGVDLARLLPEHRMPPKALAELGADLAGTIHRAHAAVHPGTGEPLRVIHRDVKPANVMLTRRGHVRLLDFGVARAAFENRETNTQGLVLGTLNYFPPEILAGAEPTPAVDIYGLGLTLWECASGRDWGTPQVHRHRFERRVDQRLTELGPDYDAVAGVVRRLLQWRPDDRPPAQQVEKLLYAAADACAGMGLRAWARKTVPPLLSAGPDIEAEVGDELIGKTLPVEAMPEPLPKVQPLPDPIVRPARPAETQTFNDLAPPSAVVREPVGGITGLALGPGGRRPRPRPSKGPAVDSGSIPELDLDPATGEEAGEDLTLTEPKAIPPAALATAILVKPTGAATEVRVRGPSREGDPPAPVEMSMSRAAASTRSPSAAADPGGDAGAETMLISAPGRFAALAASPSAATLLAEGAEAPPSAWRALASTLVMLVGAATFGGVLGAGMLLSVMVVGWLFAG